MTSELYFKQFGKMERISGFDSMVHWPNYDAAQKGLPCETPPEANVVQTVPQNFAANFGKTEISRKTIQLKAANGKYVCADGNLNNMVAANRDSAQGWETFVLILFENNEYALLAYNNKFFSAELAHDKEISASGDRINKWQTFTLENNADSSVSFKAANGKYLSVDEKSMQLFATGESIGKNEKFEMVIK